MTEDDKKRIEKQNVIITRPLPTGVKCKNGLGIVTFGKSKGQNVIICKPIHP